MKNGISVAPLLFMASFASADSSPKIVLECAINDGRIFNIEQSKAATRNSPATYTVDFVADQKEPIFKAYFSRENTGVLATVFINQNLLVSVPIIQSEKVPSGMVSATANLGGVEQEAFCKTGPAF